MHQVKNLFFLAFDLYTDLLASKHSQFLSDLSERLFRRSDIDDHHHIKISLHDRLGDVQNVDAVLRKISANARNDSYGVFSNYCNYTSDAPFTSSGQKEGNTFLQKL